MLDLKQDGIPVPEWNLTCFDDDKFPLVFDKNKDVLLAKRDTPNQYCKYKLSL